jgi:hypothetical protein
MFLAEISSDYNSSLKSQRQLSEAAGSLSIGDPVEITGDVQFRGSTGDVIGFDQNKSFVIVDLYNHGPRSFHSSDVSYNDYADSSREEEEQYDQSYDPGIFDEPDILEDIEVTGIGTYEKLDTVRARIQDIMQRISSSIGDDDYDSALYYLYRNDVLRSYLQAAADYRAQEEAKTKRTPKTQHPKYRTGGSK